MKKKTKEQQAQEQVVLAVEKIVELTSDAKTALIMLRVLFNDVISEVRE